MDVKYVSTIKTDFLSKANISYIISDSMALNYYALPIMTRDLDIIIELKVEDIDNFIYIFKNEFCVDEEMVKKDVEHGGMFNLRHNKYIFKN